MAERNESIVREDDASEPRLSYKFQRLRKRIRAAIEGGELAGKLPGERTLARQFNVNAKTLSKALTDLAAEGVLERNIGLGTFVRGQTTSSASTSALLLTDVDAAEHLTGALVAAGVQTASQAAGTELPPSLIAPYRVVLVSSDAVSDDAIRTLLVRGKDVITIDRLSTPYSTHALMSHVDRCAVEAAKEIATAAVTKLAVIAADSAIVDAVRAALPHIEILATNADAIGSAAADGFQAVLCEAAVIADVQAALANRSAVQLIGFGRCATAPASVLGFYITDEMVGGAIGEMISAGLPHKPLLLWLAGRRFDAVAP
ncbi:MAG: GntR family transcriptional regulator [Tepidisphaeraceae bacterium]